MMPDAEATAIAWAKQVPSVSALVGTRVAARLPRPGSGKIKDAPELRSPFLRVVSIDSDDLVVETTDARVVLLQWDAYAFDGFQPTPDWDKASLVIRTLMAAIVLEVGTNIAGVGYVAGFGRINGPRRFEEQTGWARFAIETLMAIRPAS